MQNQLYVTTTSTVDKSHLDARSDAAWRRATNQNPAQYEVWEPTSEQWESLPSHSLYEVADGLTAAYLSIKE